MTSTRWTAGLIALGLSLAACGTAATSDDSSTPAAPVTAAEPVTEEPAAGALEAETVATPDAAGDSDAEASSQPVTVVPAALQFSAPLVGGGELNAAELAGKPTALWFWAPN